MSRCKQIFNFSKNYTKINFLFFCKQPYFFFFFHEHPEIHTLTLITVHKQLFNFLKLVLQTATENSATGRNICLYVALSQSTDKDTLHSSKSLAVLPIANRTEGNFFVTPKDLSFSAKTIILAACQIQSLWLERAVCNNNNNNCY